MQLDANPADFKPLLEVELEPASNSEHKGTSARASIETLRDKHNAVQLGVADPIPLLDNWPADERLEAEIEARLDRFAFSCVRLSLSFIPIAAAASSGDVSTRSSRTTGAATRPSRSISSRAT